MATLPAPSPFVCANPAGSGLGYAYVRGDGRVYAVTGCAQPRALTTGYGWPLSWSPAHRYLMLGLNASTYPGAGAVVAVDPQTGAQIATRYAADFGGPAVGQTVRVFLGWIDERTFLGAVVPIVAGEPYGEAKGVTTIVRVALGSDTETVVAPVTWWANWAGSAPKVAAQGRYLFYGGYQSAAEGQAYLHRLDLATGEDTRLVPLGLSGNGGCQGTPICDWTAPWDVSADGGHILYHRPGAASLPSDVNFPPDTPLLYANADGSSASRPFGNQLAAGIITSPVFSPDGAYVAATGSTYATGATGGATPPAAVQPRVGVVRPGGTPTLVDGGWVAWRGDSAAMVMDAQGRLTLYILATGESSALEAGAESYVWA